MRQHFLQDLMDTDLLRLCLRDFAHHTGSFQHPIDQTDQFFMVFSCQGQHFSHLWMAEVLMILFEQFKRPSQHGQWRA